MDRESEKRKVFFEKIIFGILYSYEGVLDMNYTLPEFDEELYKSLVEIVAEDHRCRFRLKRKSRFISNLSTFMKTNNDLFNVKKIGGMLFKNYYLTSANSSYKVIFCAHYDTFIKTAGFNDNSSGIILALMFLLKKNIPVLLTDGEEIFFYGAWKVAIKNLFIKNSFKDKTIFVLDSVGVGKYIIYNCSRDYKPLLETIEKEKHLLFKKNLSFGTDAFAFLISNHKVISLSRSESEKEGTFEGMHNMKDIIIEIDKMKEMYYLIGEILEKLNLIPLNNMEKI